LLSHFLPGLAALPGAVALAKILSRLFGYGCTSFTCCYEPCTSTLLRWARDNVVLTSLGVLVVPLIFGILLDNWRHDLWPCHEDKDDRWDRGLEALTELPTHLFRFMYDEYYYYVEFNGNTCLAIGFSGIVVLANAWVSGSLFTLHSVPLLAVPTLLCWFLWVSYKRALSGFFGDLSTTAHHYDTIVRPKTQT
jgi:hypothetical protein